MSQLKPTVDLGYPTDAHGRIPAFGCASKFWGRASARSVSRPHGSSGTAQRL